VWEANHVWLVYCLVVLWTAFPQAFVAIAQTLWVPMGLAAMGIVARGAGFAFRKAVATTPQRRAFGALFATSSVVVPFCMGAIAGGIASGRVPVSGGGDLWSSWLNPASLLGGVLAVATCAYLAATYLVWDARRLGAADLAETFRRRALVTAAVTGVVALAGIAVLAADAPRLFDHLTGRAAPLVAASALGGLTSIALLWRRARRGAREAAMVAVAAVVWAWGVAQWPYLLPPGLTVAEAAAPTPALAGVLVVAAVAVALVVPALGVLYLLDQRNLLEEAGGASASVPRPAPQTGQG
jgi:cytochrome d ubiquinol oxidase subunit II